MMVLPALHQNVGAAALGENVQLTTRDNSHYHKYFLFFALNIKP